MLLWRISSHASLDGHGGLISNARWNFRGVAVVYLAESPAGALLEVLVHQELDLANLPPNYKLLKIEAPDTILPETVEESQMPHGWREDQQISRKIGTEWLTGREAALLRVPSAIVPETFNILLNPMHSDAANLQILWHRSYPWMHGSGEGTKANF